MHVPRTLLYQLKWHANTYYGNVKRSKNFYFPFHI